MMDDKECHDHGDGQDQGQPWQVLGGSRAKPKVHMNVENRRELDLKQFADMAQEIGFKFDINDVETDKCFRLGKIRDDNAPRPLLVRFRENECKVKFMKSLGKLKETVYESVTIADDMTKEDRESNKKLYSEAKNLQQCDSTGLWIYKVRGPPGAQKVVKIKKYQAEG